MAARRLGRLQKRLNNFQAGVQNTLELVREGRLSAPYQAPFDIELEHPVFRLRHYPRPAGVAQNIQRPILLVPPLMIASEIYDLSPELSAVAWLSAQGADVWLVDFGAPEHQEGGMQRTLDDHVTAVSLAIDELNERTGQGVHLTGYSQGGMFCYQTAAYRKSAGIASVITFGSPVDVHRNMPNVHENLAETLMEGASPALRGAVEKLGGLPGFMSMSGFKILSGAKELQSMLEFFRVIHDRERAEKRERQRRFLGGEGFVAWPGPALRKFIDEMVVNNRMVTGGLVINDQPVTLADITCPLLYFVGSRDEFGRPPSVRAISRAAPNAQIHEVELNAGHFGLVVGSKSLKYTWPTVCDWMAWLEDAGPQPNFDCEGIGATRGQVHHMADDASALYDIATDVLDRLWHNVSDATLDINRSVENLRWQIPRLIRIRQLQDGSRASMAKVLSEQAVAIADKPFFLWEDRSYSYAQADERVDQFAHALLNDGVRRGQRVAILMDNQPDYLVSVCALNRIGAVAVLLNASATGKSLQHALTVGGAQRVIADGAHMKALRGKSVERIYALDESKDSDKILNLNRHLPPPGTSLPEFAPINQGRSEDLALLIFTSGTTGLPKAVKISNRRWVAGALGAAAATRATSKDTVFATLPLYHATGMILAVGGALVGGARLALVPRFSASQFWPQVRRYGATIVIYVGELCRYLLNNPASANDKEHPVRVFGGNGLRAEVWKSFNERFAPDQIVEFYAASEGNVHLVNLSGEKIGSVGKPLIDAGGIELVRYDVAKDEVLRDEHGFVIPCGDNEAGLLISRIDAEHPLTRFDGYADDNETEAKIVRDAVERGDAWFNTGDLLKRDADGDYWFVDRVGDTFRWHGENVSTQQVADALDRMPGIEASVVYGISLPGREGRAGMAAIQWKAGRDFDGKALYELVARELTDAARPRAVRLVKEFTATDSMKFIKYQLQQQGCDPTQVDDPLYYLDAEQQAYLPLTAALYPSSLDQ